MNCEYKQVPIQDEIRRAATTSTERLSRLKSINTNRCIDAIKNSNNSECVCNRVRRRSNATKIYHDSTYEPANFSSKSEYLKYNRSQQKSNNCNIVNLNNKKYHKQGAATSSEKILNLKTSTQNHIKFINSLK